MSKVKFLQDFQGRETKEQYYKLGDVVDLPDDQVSLLLKDGRVEVVNEKYYGGQVGEELKPRDDALPEPESIQQGEPIMTTKNQGVVARRGRK